MLDVLLLEVLVLDVLVVSMGPPLLVDETPVPPVLDVVLLEVLVLEELVVSMGPPLVVPLVPPLVLLLVEDVVPPDVVEPPPLEVLVVPEVPDVPDVPDVPSPVPALPDPPEIGVMFPRLVEVGGRSSSLASPHAATIMAPTPNVTTANIPSFTAISLRGDPLHRSCPVEMLPRPYAERS